MLVRVATSIMYSFVLEPYTNHKAGGKSITLWPVHCSCSKIPCCAFKIPISDCAMWDLHGVEQLMHQARRLYLKRRSRSCFWMNSWQDALALHQALHVFCSYKRVKGRIARVLSTSDGASCRACMAGRAMFGKIVAHEHIKAATVKPGELSMLQTSGPHTFLESTWPSLSNLRPVPSHSLMHVATPSQLAALLHSQQHSPTHSYTTGKRGV